MTADEAKLSLGPDLAHVLGLPTRVSRRLAAERLAELADLPKPRSSSSVLVLSEIVAAIQRDVIDHPDMRMDRAIAADTALARGCIRAGEEAVRAADDELGYRALSVNVGDTLHMKVAPALARRGAIQLVGEPR